MDDWDRHIVDVGENTVPLPAALETLLEQVSAAIEKLADDSPTAAVKASRKLEVIALRTAHWPAQKAAEREPEAVAAKLGLAVDATRALLARFGGWNVYR
ncbi:hypothetical protein ACIGFK_34290 [Streptomyces sp. NPDC085524]|uniref:hypothetical protein n=1 Tax=Streptomyces sp. NPDC085524 TaxID=3365728 RepID=UPI0037D95206